MHEQIAYLVGNLSQRVTSLEEKQAKMRSELDQLTTWARRLGILAALWASAIASHAKGDTAAEALAALVKVALSLSK